MKTSHLCAALLIAIASSACGGSPKPTEQVGQTQGALHAARAIGAEEVPQAKLMARMADDELEQAHQLMDDGDHAGAQAILARARADAELALQLARRAKAERELEQLQAALSTTNTPSQSASVAADHE